MKPAAIKPWSASLILGLALPAAFPAGAVDLFTATTLVSNQPGASVQDTNLVNPWGVSFSSTGPFWVSDNGSGVSTLYSVNPTTGATAKQGLNVTIPGNGSVTGQVFNSGGSGAFGGDAFLFVSEDGTISGWRGALGSSAETLQAASTADVYKGAAFASTGGHSYLYAANFKSGAVDVLKGDGSAPALAGTFTDPNLPAGYAPFNIQQLAGNLFVTYAQRSPTGIGEVAGPGLGYIDEFDVNGQFVKRLASGGVLNAPWGLALAPSSWGSVAGELLVGNFGDGKINVFDPSTGAALGALLGADGQPLVIGGLWDLIVGNGGSGGSSADVYFTAGPNNETNGIFGAIAAVPLPTSAWLFLGGLSGLGVMMRRRTS